LFSLDPEPPCVTKLVLQFAADTLGDYDSLAAMENQLIGALGENVVDGHDMGSGEANIFIHTSDPQGTFGQLLPLLKRTPHFAALTAAYRRTDEEHYHVLWPENSSREFSVA
jgi:hypothetical protein